MRGVSGARGERGRGGSILGPEDGVREGGGRRPGAGGVRAEGRGRGRGQLLRPGAGGGGGVRRGGPGPALLVPGRVGVEALLLLPAVAEPDPHHLALHVQVVRHEGDLLPGRLRVLVEGSLQRDPDSRVDRGALLSPPDGKIL